MKKAKRFWLFNPWDKYDTLELPKHDYLVLGALNDPETRIEIVDKDNFILYGEEEALLLFTTIPVVKIGLWLYLAVVHLFGDK